MGHPRLWRKAPYGENVVSNKVQSVTASRINYQHQEQNTENVVNYGHHIDSPLFVCAQKGPRILILDLAFGKKTLQNDLPSPTNSLVSPTQAALPSDP